MQVHDLLLMDLDGVVYIGSEAVDHAVEALNVARAGGSGVAYVTNNASRPPTDVVAHLERLGLLLTFEDVLTSAQATATWLRAEQPAGTRVLAVGGPGVHQALDEAGFAVVTDADDSPDVVVMGFGPDVSWRQLAQACRAIRGGAAFIATNTDLTVPTPFGPAPGNGALVRAVSEATGVKPSVIGKPEPTMFAQAVERRGAQAPLVVGDRLDTDIQGAQAAGIPSLLVMTGVTDVLALVNAPPNQRPTYVASDLRGLALAHPATTRDGDRWRCGAASAHRASDRLVVQVEAGPGHALDGLRAACAAAWEGSTGTPGVTRVMGIPTG